MAKRQKDYGTGIPRYEMEALARALLPTMQAMFEDENIQREFAEWQAKRAEESKTKKTKKADR